MQAIELCTHQSLVQGWNREELWSCEKRSTIFSTECWQEHHIVKRREGRGLPLSCELLVLHLTTSLYSQCLAWSAFRETEYSVLIAYCMIRQMENSVSSIKLKRRDEYRGMYRFKVRKKRVVILDFGTWRIFQIYNCRSGLRNFS